MSIIIILLNTEFNTLSCHSSVRIRLKLVVTWLFKNIEEIGKEVVTQMSKGIMSMML